MLERAIHMRYHPISVLIWHERRWEKDTRSGGCVWSYLDAAQAFFLVALRILVCVRVLQSRIQAYQGVQWGAVSLILVQPCDG